MTGRVLIVDALSAGSGKRRSSRDSIGCGPRTIAGVFEQNQIDCRILRSEDIRFRKQLKPFDHLAISAMTMDFPATRKIIQSWRKSKRSGRVIIGGPIASDPSRGLKRLKPDLLVIGEGEATLEELIEVDYFESNDDISYIHGIAYDSKEGVVITETRQLVPEENLSSYKPSTVRLVDYKAYQASKVYVEVLRGCSNFRRTRLRTRDRKVCSDCENCDDEDARVRMDCPEDIPPGCGFCSVPSTWGPPRSRDVRSIVEEIIELIDLGVHRIVLEAPDFLDYKRGGYPLTDPCAPDANLEMISNLLKEITTLQPFTNNEAHLAIENIKACLFTDDVARVISEAVPNTSPNIGLETGSEEHARLIGKCGTPNDVIQAVRTARKYGMSPFVYLIYGLPSETEETVAKSIQQMKSLSEAGVERIILYGFRALPGSAFAGYPEPRSTDPFGERMRQVAHEINRSQKDEYIGKIVKGVVAEPSWSRRGYTMVYPLGEGPIMTVLGGFSPGTIVIVRITDSLSDGLLKGVVIKK